MNPANVSNIEATQRDGHVGQPTNPIASDAVTSIESPRLRRFGGAFGVVSTGLLLLATAAPAAFAAQAVTITGQPIQVQGTVETLDDSLHQPYFQSTQIALEDGHDTATITFSVPAGKRLVIETVAFRVLPAAGENIVVDLFAQPAGEPRSTHLPLPLQSKTNFLTNTIYTSTIPVRLRVDSGQITMSCLRDATVGTASFIASVAGYLVDL